MAAVFVIAISDNAGWSKWGEEHEIVKGGLSQKLCILAGLYIG